MNMGDKKAIQIELYEAEIEYLKEYLELIKSGGIVEVAKACEERNFAIVPFNQIIKRILGKVEYKNTEANKEEVFEPYKELLNIITKSSDEILASPRDRAIEAYTYLRECSKFDRELCREFMQILKGNNQLHYLLEMEGLSMYERADIDEFLIENGNDGI